MSFKYCILGLTALAAISSAQSTTEVSIFRGGVSTVLLTDMVASVINADATATTYEMGCRADVTSCVLPIPATITDGPSTYAADYAWTSAEDQVSYSASFLETCKITGSTKGAQCSQSLVETVTTDGGEIFTSASTTISIPSSEIYYDILTVTGGVEKLQTTTATQASSTGAAVPNKQVGGVAAAVGMLAWALV